MDTEKLMNLAFFQEMRKFQGGRNRRIQTFIQNLFYQHSLIFLNFHL